MNKGAADNNKNPINKGLEELLQTISPTDPVAVQSLLDRAVEIALAEAKARHSEELAKTEERHGQALAQAKEHHDQTLAQTEQHHQQELAEAERRHEAAMAEAEERHKAEIHALYEKFALERQRIYGRKSERHPNQPPVFDEAEVAAKDSTEADDQAGIPPEPEADVDSASGAKRKTSTKARGKRSPIPPHVRRFDVFLELPEDQRVCPCCNQTMAEIGEQISEQIDIIPMQFLVTRFHRKRYACGHREHKPAIAPRPPQVLPKSNATNAFLAMLMTMKYVDGCVLRTIKQKDLQGRCFIKDEGRPLEVGFQEQASNHHKLRNLRVSVVSVDGKGGYVFRQVRVMETSASELLMTCRNVLGDVKTGRDPLPRDKDEGYLITAHLASGMKAA